MPNEKPPVIIYIKGYGHFNEKGEHYLIPDEKDLRSFVESRKKLGQDVLMIPPLDKEGYNKFLVSEGYDIDYVKNELEKAFGEGGEFAGRDYISIFNGHGGIRGDSDLHISALGYEADYSSSYELYDALLSINGKCKGILNLSCFGMAAGPNISRAISNQVQKNPSFEFSESFKVLALADYSSVSYASDVKENLTSLTNSEEILTMDDVEEIVLSNASIKTSISSATFAPEDYTVEKVAAKDYYTFPEINFVDYQYNLTLFYSYYQDSKKSFPEYVYFEKKGFTEEEYNILKGAIGKPTAREFSIELNRSNIYSKTIAIATDEIIKYKITPTRIYDKTTHYAGNFYINSAVRTSDGTLSKANTHPNIFRVGDWRTRTNQFALNDEGDQKAALLEATYNLAQYQTDKFFEYNDWRKALKRAYRGSDSKAFKNNVSMAYMVGLMHTSDPLRRLTRAAEIKGKIVDAYQSSLENIVKNSVVEILEKNPRSLLREDILKACQNISQEFLIQSLEEVARKDPLAILSKYLLNKRGIIDEAEAKAIFNIAYENRGNIKIAGAVMGNYDAGAKWNKYSDNEQTKQLMAEDFLRLSVEKSNYSACLSYIGRLLDVYLFEKDLPELEQILRAAMNNNDEFAKILPSALKHQVKDYIFAKDHFFDENGNLKLEKLPDVEYAEVKEKYPYAFAANTIGDNLTVNNGKITPPTGGGDEVAVAGGGDNPPATGGGDNPPATGGDNPLKNLYKGLLKNDFNEVQLAIEADPSLVNHVFSDPTGSYDFDGATPISWAMSDALEGADEEKFEEKWKIVEYLLGKGANTNVNSEEHYNSALNQVLYKFVFDKESGTKISPECLEMINKNLELIFKNASNLDLVDNDYSSLQLAIRTGNAELVQKVIDAGADVNQYGINYYYKNKTKGFFSYVEGSSNGVTKNQETALYQAIKLGHTEIAELLIKHGADVNKKSLIGIDEFGDAESEGYPLHLATSTNDSRVVAAIIDSTDDREVLKDILNQKNSNHESAIEIAASDKSSNLYKIAKQLIEAGADISSLFEPSNGDISVYLKLKKLSAGYFGNSDNFRDVNKIDHLILLLVNSDKCPGEYVESFYTDFTLGSDDRYNTYNEIIQKLKAEYPDIEIPEPEEVKKLNQAKKYVDFINVLNNSLSIVLNIHESYSYDSGNYDLQLIADKTAKMVNNFYNVYSKDWDKASVEMNKYSVDDFRGISVTALSIADKLVIPSLLQTEEAIAAFNDDDNMRTRLALEALESVFLLSNKNLSLKSMVEMSNAYQSKRVGLFAGINDGKGTGQINSIFADYSPDIKGGFFSTSDKNYVIKEVTSLEELHFYAKTFGTCLAGVQDVILEGKQKTFIICDSESKTPLGYVNTYFNHDGYFDSVDVVQYNNGSVNLNPNLLRVVEELEEKLKSSELREVSARGLVERGNMGEALGLAILRAGYDFTSPEMTIGGQTVNLIQRAFDVLSGKDYIDNSGEWKQAPDIKTNSGKNQLLKNYPDYKSFYDNYKAAGGGDNPPTVGGDEVAVAGGDKSWDNKLIIAIITNDIEGINRAIANGADIKATINHDSFRQLLLQNNIPNSSKLWQQEDIGGVIRISEMAINTGNVDVVKALKKHGLDYNAYYSGVDINEIYEFRPTHPMQSAIRNNDIEMIKYLISESVGLKNRVEDIKKDNPRVEKIKVDDSYYHIKINDLQYAMSLGNTETILEVLKHADPKKLNTNYEDIQFYSDEWSNSNDEVRSNLSYFILRVYFNEDISVDGALEVVKSMIDKGFDINESSNYENRNPLAAASYLDSDDIRSSDAYIAITKLLLESGADAIYERNGEKISLLNDRAKNGIDGTQEQKYRYDKILIDHYVKNNLDLNLPGTNGCSALANFIISEYNHNNSGDVISYLLGADATLLNQPISLGKIINGNNENLCEEYGSAEHKPAKIIAEQFPNEQFYFDLFTNENLDLESRKFFPVYDFGEEYSHANLIKILKEKGITVPSSINYGKEGKKYEYACFASVLDAACRIVDGIEGEVGAFDEYDKDAQKTKIIAELVAKTYQRNKNNWSKASDEISKINRNKFSDIADMVHYVTNITVMPSYINSEEKKAFFNNQDIDIEELRNLNSLDVLEALFVNDRGKLDIVNLSKLSDSWHDKRDALENVIRVLPSVTGNWHPILSDEKGYIRTDNPKILIKEITNSTELDKIGSDLKICIGGKGDKCLAGEFFVFGMYDAQTKEPIGTMRYEYKNNEFKLVEMTDAANAKTFSKGQRAVKDWFENEISKGNITLQNKNIGDIDKDKPPLSNVEKIQRMAGFDPMQDRQYTTKNGDVVTVNAWEEAIKNLSGKTTETTGNYIGQEVNVVTVRAKKGLPLLDEDYSKLLGNIASKAETNISKMDGYEPENTPKGMELMTAERLAGGGDKSPATGGGDNPPATGGGLGETQPAKVAGFEYDAGKEAFVMILGYGFFKQDRDGKEVHYFIPPLEDVYKLQQAAKNNGQYCVIIPEIIREGEEGNYTYKTKKDVLSSFYDLEYIKKEYESHFGKNGAFEGKNVNVVIDAHGVIDRQNVHIHDFNKTAGGTSSEETYKILLENHDKYQVNIADLSCHSGAGIENSRQAIIDIVTESNKNLGSNVGYFAAARPSQLHRADDNKNMIGKLITDIESGKEITFESIKFNYKLGLDNIQPTISKTFEKEEYTLSAVNNLDRDKVRVSYFDDGEELEKLYSYLKQNPEKIPTKEWFEAIFSDKLSEEGYPSDYDCFKNAFSAETFMDFKNKMYTYGGSSLYGKFLIVSERYFKEVNNGSVRDNYIFDKDAHFFSLYKTEKYLNIFDNDRWKGKILRHIDEPIKDNQIIVIDNNSAIKLSTDSEVKIDVKDVIIINPNVTGYDYNKIIKNNDDKTIIIDPNNNVKIQNGKVVIVRENVISLEEDDIKNINPKKFVYGIKNQDAVCLNAITFASIEDPLFLITNDSWEKFIEEKTYRDYPQGTSEEVIKGKIAETINHYKTSAYKRVIMDYDAYVGELRWGKLSEDDFNVIKSTSENYIKALTTPSNFLSGYQVNLMGCVDELKPFIAFTAINELAEFDPKAAKKYLEKVLDSFEEEGLSFSDYELYLLESKINNISTKLVSGMALGDNVEEVTRRAGGSTEKKHDATVIAGRTEKEHDATVREANGHYNANSASNLGGDNSPPTVGGDEPKATPTSDEWITLDEAKKYLESLKAGDDKPKYDAVQIQAFESIVRDMEKAAAAGETEYSAHGVSIDDIKSFVRNDKDGEVKISRSRLEGEALKSAKVDSDGVKDLLEGVPVKQVAHNINSLINQRVDAIKNEKYFYDNLVLFEGKKVDYQKSKVIAKLAGNLALKFDDPDNNSAFDNLAMLFEKTAIHSDNPNYYVVFDLGDKGEFRIKPSDYITIEINGEDIKITANPKKIQNTLDALYGDGISPDKIRVSVDNDNFTPLSDFDFNKNFILTATVLNYKNTKKIAEDISVGNLPNLALENVINKLAIAYNQGETSVSFGIGKYDKIDVEKATVETVIYGNVEIKIGDFVAIDKDGNVLIKTFEKDEAYEMNKLMIMAVENEAKAIAELKKNTSPEIFEAYLVEIEANFENISKGDIPSRVSTSLNNLSTLGNETTVTERLIEAVKKDQIDKVKQAIADGADVNVRLEDGNPLAYHAFNLALEIDIDWEIFEAITQHKLYDASERINVDDKSFNMTDYLLNLYNTTESKAIKQAIEGQIITIIEKTANADFVKTNPLSRNGKTTNAEIAKSQDKLKEASALIDKKIQEYWDKILVDNVHSDKPNKKGIKKALKNGANPNASKPLFGYDVAVASLRRALMDNNFEIYELLIDNPKTDLSIEYDIVVEFGEESREITVNQLDIIINELAQTKNDETYSKIISILEKVIAKMPADKLGRANPLDEYSRNNIDIIRGLGYQAIANDMENKAYDEANTKLIDAVKNGDAEAAREALREGADPNLKNNNNPIAIKALKAAYKSRNWDLYQLFLDHENYDPTLPLNGSTQRNALDELLLNLHNLQGESDFEAVQKATNKYLQQMADKFTADDLNRLNKVAFPQDFNINLATELGVDKSILEVFDKTIKTHAANAKILEAVEKWRDSEITWQQLEKQIIQFLDEGADPNLQDDFGKPIADQLMAQEYVFNEEPSIFQRFLGKGYDPTQHTKYNKELSNSLDKIIHRLYVEKDEPRFDDIKQKAERDIASMADKFTADDLDKTNPYINKTNKDLLNDLGLSDLVKVIQDKPLSPNDILKKAITDTGSRKYQNAIIALAKEADPNLRTGISGISVAHTIYNATGSNDSWAKVFDIITKTQGFDYNITYNNGDNTKLLDKIIVDLQEAKVRKDDADYNKLKTFLLNIVRTNPNIDFTKENSLSLDKQTNQDIIDSIDGLGAEINEIRKAYQAEEQKTQPEKIPDERLLDAVRQNDPNQALTVLEQGADVNQNNTVIYAIYELALDNYQWDDVFKDLIVKLSQEPDAYFVKSDGVLLFDRIVLNLAELETEKGSSGKDNLKRIIKQKAQLEEYLGIIIKNNPDINLDQKNSLSEEQKTNKDILSEISSEYEYDKSVYAELELDRKGAIAKREATKNLIEAVKNDDVAAAQKALEQGADVNLRTTDGYGSDVLLAQLALDNGNMNATEGKGGGSYKILELIVKSQDFNSTEPLLADNTDITFFDKLLEVISIKEDRLGDTEIDTEIDALKSIAENILYNDPKITAEFLSETNPLIEGRDDSSRFGIIDDLDLDTDGLDLDGEVEYMEDESRVAYEEVKPDDLELNASLHKAIKERRFEEVEKLITQGAEPNSLYEGQPAINLALERLLLAVRDGSIENSGKILNLLLNEGATTSSKDNRGYTAIDIVFDALVADKNGKKVLNYKNFNALEKNLGKIFSTAENLDLPLFNGKNAMQNAIDLENSKIVEELAKSGKVDINGYYEGRVTYLEKSLANKDNAVSKALIKNGADVNKPSYYKDKKTYPIHQAARNNDTETLKLLLENGADINARDGSNMTALDIAIISKLELRSDIEDIKLLVNSGADISKQTFEGQPSYYDMIAFMAKKNGYSQIPNELINFLSTHESFPMQKRKDFASNDINEGKYEKLIKALEKDGVKIPKNDKYGKQNISSYEYACFINVVEKASLIVDNITKSKGDYDKDFIEGAKTDFIKHLYQQNGNNWRHASNEVNKFSNSDLTDISKAIRLFSDKVIMPEFHATETRSKEIHKNVNDFSFFDFERLRGEIALEAFKKQFLERENPINLSAMVEISKSITGNEAAIRNLIETDDALYTWHKISKGEIATSDNRFVIKEIDNSLNMTRVATNLGTCHRGKISNCRDGEYFIFEVYDIEEKKAVGTIRFGIGDKIKVPNSAKGLKLIEITGTNDSKGNDDFLASTKFATDLIESIERGEVNIDLSNLGEINPSVERTINQEDIKAITGYSVEYKTEDGKVIKAWDRAFTIFGGIKNNTTDGSNNPTVINNNGDEVQVPSLRSKKKQYIIPDEYRAEGMTAQDYVNQSGLKKILWDRAAYLSKERNTISYPEVDKTLDKATDFCKKYPDAKIKITIKQERMSQSKITLEAYNEEGKLVDKVDLHKVQDSNLEYVEGCVKKIHGSDKVIKDTDIASAPERKVAGIGDPDEMLKNAIINNDVAAAKKALEQGADVNGKFEDDYYIQIALRAAEKTNNYEIAKMLVSHDDFDSEYETKSTIGSKDSTIFDDIIYDSVVKAMRDDYITIGHKKPQDTRTENYKEFVELLISKAKDRQLDKANPYYLSPNIEVVITNKMLIIEDILGDKDALEKLRAKPKDAVEGVADAANLPDTKGGTGEANVTDKTTNTLTGGGTGESNETDATEGNAPNIENSRAASIGDGAGASDATADASRAGASDATADASGAENISIGASTDDGNSGTTTGDAGSPPFNPPSPGADVGYGVAGTTTTGDTNQEEEELPQGYSVDADTDTDVSAAGDTDVEAPEPEAARPRNFVQRLFGRNSSVISLITQQLNNSDSSFNRFSNILVNGQAGSGAMAGYAILQKALGKDDDYKFAEKRGGATLNEANKSLAYDVLDFGFTATEGVAHLGKLNRVSTVLGKLGIVGHVFGAGSAYHLAESHLSSFNPSKAAVSYGEYVASTVGGMAGGGIAAAVGCHPAVTFVAAVVGGIVMSKPGGEVGKVVLSEKMIKDALEHLGTQQPEFAESLKKMVRENPERFPELIQISKDSGKDLFAAKTPEQLAEAKNKLENENKALGDIAALEFSSKALNKIYLELEEQRQKVDGLIESGAKEKVINKELAVYKQMLSDVNKIIEGKEGQGSFLLEYNPYDPNANEYTQKQTEFIRKQLENLVIMTEIAEKIEVLKDENLIMFETQDAMMIDPYVGNAILIHNAFQKGRLAANEQIKDWKEAIEESTKQLTEQYNFIVGAHERFFRVNPEDMKLIVLQQNYDDLVAKAKNDYCIKINTGLDYSGVRIKALEIAKGEATETFVTAQTDIKTGEVVMSIPFEGYDLRDIIVPLNQATFSSGESLNMQQMAILLESNLMNLKEEELLTLDLRPYDGKSSILVATYDDGKVVGYQLPIDDNSFPIMMMALNQRYTPYENVADPTAGISAERKFVEDGSLFINPDFVLKVNGKDYNYGINGVKAIERGVEDKRDLMYHINSLWNKDTGFNFKADDINPLKEPTFILPENWFDDYEGGFYEYDKEKNIITYRRPTKGIFTGENALTEATLAVAEMNAERTKAEGEAMKLASGGLPEEASVAIGILPDAIELTYAATVEPPVNPFVLTTSVAVAKEEAGGGNELTTLEGLNLGTLPTKTALAYNTGNISDLGAAIQPSDVANTVLQNTSSAFQEAVKASEENIITDIDPLYRKTSRKYLEMLEEKGVVIKGLYALDDVAKVVEALYDNVQTEEGCTKENLEKLEIATLYYLHKRAENSEKPYASVDYNSATPPQIDESAKTFSNLVRDISEGSRKFDYIFIAGLITKGKLDYKHLLAPSVEVDPSSLPVPAASKSGFGIGG